MEPVWEPQFEKPLEQNGELEVIKWREQIEIILPIDEGYFELLRGLRRCLFNWGEIKHLLS